MKHDLIPNRGTALVDADGEKLNLTLGTDWQILVGARRPVILPLATVVVAICDLVGVEAPTMVRPRRRIFRETSVLTDRHRDTVTITRLRRGMLRIESTGQVYLPALTVLNAIANVEHQDLFPPNALAKSIARV